MTALVLDHSVVVGGNDLSNLVTSIDRKHCICETIATGSFMFTDLPVQININPYDLIVVEEMGNLVFTGYVTNRRIETNPFQHVVEFADKAILLKDYFLTEPKDANGETARTWISVFCSLAGVPHQFDTQLPITIPAPGPGTHTWEMGTSALSIIEELLIYNGYWMYSAPNGVIHFSQGHYVPIFNTIGSGINILESLRNRSIIPARNRVVVFGVGGIFAEENYSVPELAGTTITAVVASPYIKSQSGVNTLADRLALAFSRVKDEKQFKIIGDTDITLAQFANIKDGWLGINTTGQITGVKSHMGNDGYFMDVTVDQYCPKVWGSYGWDEDDEGLPFTEALSAYSGDAGHFWHAAPEGSIFVERNGGLTGTSIADFCGRMDPFWPIKKSSIDPEKVILLKGDLGHIYKSIDAGITWSDCTPATDPPNTWSDTTPPTASTVNYIRIASSNITSGLHFALASYQGDSSIWHGWILMTVDDGVNWTWGEVTSLPATYYESGGKYYMLSEYAYAPVGTAYVSDRPNALGLPDAVCATFASDDNWGDTGSVVWTLYLGGVAHGVVGVGIINYPGSGGLFQCQAVADVSEDGITWTNINTIPMQFDQYMDSYYFRLTPYPEGRYLRLTINNKGNIFHSWRTKPIDAIYVTVNAGFTPDASSENRLIWSDVDGDNLWITLWGNNVLYLEKRSLADMSLVTQYSLGACTLAQLNNKTYIAYVFAAANTILDSNDVYLFGKMSAIPGLTGDQTVARSINAGTTWTSIKTTPAFTAFADLGGEYIGMGSDRYFYKGTGVLLPVGYPNIGVSPGSLTVSGTGAIAVGSDGGSVVKESFDNGLTWTDISAGITGYGAINSLTYV